MPRNLLLADDSITIQKVVGITFAGEDFSIVAVDNGEDAIRKAREGRPDIILADVVMPKKNGYELCEAVKSDPELAHIPVLLLAGTFEAFDEARARAVRADGHIAKPFESQALVNKVRELLEHRAVVPERPTVPADQQSAKQAATSQLAAKTPVLSRPAVPPVVQRPPPPVVAPAPAFLTRTGEDRSRAEATPPGSPPDRSPVGELDWAALGFETDAVARPAPAPEPEGWVRTAPGLSPAPSDLTSRPLTPAGSTIPPAPRPAQARAGIAAPAAAPAPPKESAAPMPGPAPRSPSAPSRDTPELLPFGEPIDLADLEVVEEVEPEQELEPAPGVLASRFPEPVAPPVPDVPRAPASNDGGEALLRHALSQASREVIERIAWEVIPTLAETIIREHVERLVEKREK